jgi:arabinose-5-phosphate isomerase
MSAEASPQFIPAETVGQIREAREIIQGAAAALVDLARRIDTAFCAAVEQIASMRGAVVVCGMGKAGLVGRKLVATFNSTGTRALWLHPAEAVHGDIGCLCADDVLLMLSNSGETEEICRLLPCARQIGATIIAITSRQESTLGRCAGIVLETGPVREAGQWGLAPTTSTSVMLALGDALALVVSRKRGFSREQFARLHPAGNLGRQMTRAADVMRVGDQLRIAPMSATIREVLVGMRRPGRRTGAVMLVNEECQLAGLFTDSDLVRLLESRRERQLDRPIAEVMTVHPKSVTSETSLADVVGLLSQHRISELPVVDAEGRPLGMIDITDLIGLIPEDRTD